MSNDVMTTRLRALARAIERLSGRDLMRFADLALVGYGDGSKHDLQRQSLAFAAKVVQS